LIKSSVILDLLWHFSNIGKVVEVVLESVFHVLHEIQLIRVSLTRVLNDELVSSATVVVVEYDEQPDRTTVECSSVHGRRSFLLR
jgi:hypothetical protein